MTSIPLNRQRSALGPSRVIALVGLGCLALIAGAWFFEIVVGLRPCKLCLEQRLPHYAAMGLAAAGLVLARSSRLQWLVLLGLAGLMVWSTGLGVYHAGVEWGWFAGPNDCGGAAAPKPLLRSRNWWPASAPARSAIRSSVMTPGPLGMCPTRPSAEAPKRMAVRASSRLLMQQILMRGGVIPTQL